MNDDAGGDIDHVDTTIVQRGVQIQGPGRVLLAEGG
jgi:hypothetical protein